MNTDYSLSDSYVSVGGDESKLKPVHDFAAKWVGGHATIALALIVVLMIVVLFLVFKKKESFMPTSTLRFQQRDGLGESMEGDRSQSVFAQTTQDASAASSGMSSASVLGSAAFDCANRKSVTDDAWAWMSSVAGESMAGAPKSDNDFSRVLAGQ